MAGRRTIALAVAVGALMTVTGQAEARISVIPAPASLHATGESFRLTKDTQIVARTRAARKVAEQLAAVLRRDRRARERFRRSVAVSHSGFFRDPEQFEALEERILPRLLEHSTRLRVWSAGCANGLELWSVAVVLSRLGALDGAYLLGSDLLEENLAVARAGVYEVVEISPAQRLRARWERRDLALDPAPPGRFDLVMCRNVAIYLHPDAKARLHRLLVGALSPGGVVMLGRSERLGDPAAPRLRRVEPHIYERPR
jgi:chemotaxis protein methyltransferase CheR